nr:unnamed protein product [Naegleria fowleri]
MSSHKSQQQQGLVDDDDEHYCHHYIFSQLPIELVLDHVCPFFSDNGLLLYFRSINKLFDQVITRLHVKTLMIRNHFPYLLIPPIESFFELIRKLEKLEYILTSSLQINYYQCPLKDYLEQICEMCPNLKKIEPALFHTYQLDMNVVNKYCKNYEEIDSKNTQSLQTMVDEHSNRFSIFNLHQCEKIDFIHKLHHVSTVNLEDLEEDFTIPIQDWFDHVNQELKFRISHNASILGKLESYTHSKESLFMSETEQTPCSYPEHVLIHANYEYGSFLNRHLPTTLEEEMDDDETSSNTILLIHPNIYFSLTTHNIRKMKMEILRQCKTIRVSDSYHAHQMMNQDLKFLLQNAPQLEELDLSALTVEWFEPRQQITSEEMNSSSCQTKLLPKKKVMIQSPFLKQNLELAIHYRNQLVEFMMHCFTLQRVRIAIPFTVLVHCGKFLRESLCHEKLDRYIHLDWVPRNEFYAVVNSESSQPHMLLKRRTR